FAVRAVWEGARVVNVPVNVCYPPGGLSHFDVARDFPAMGSTYARLWLGMLTRAPSLLARRSG
ncbi:MAG: glycosyltransferase family 2 protein, partial [Myxococcota bacterium]